MILGGSEAEKNSKWRDKDKKIHVTISVRSDTILPPILRVSNRQTSCHDLFKLEQDLRSDGLLLV